MTSRVRRTERALVFALALVALLATSLIAPSAARAVSDGGCTYYANQNGFGYYCADGGRGGGGQLPTWKQRLEDAGPPTPQFYACRLETVPPDVVARLGKLDPGKTWFVRDRMTNVDLNTTNGGDNLTIVREYAQLDQQQQAQCPTPIPPYMEQFWSTYEADYPAPLFVVAPSGTARVNSPTYFPLDSSSAVVVLSQDCLHGQKHLPPDVQVTGKVKCIPSTGQFSTTMSGVVKKMTIDFDKSTGESSMTCVYPMVRYDNSKGVNDQTSTCKHVWKRSSANQDNHVDKMTITESWQVRYCKTVNGACQWTDVTEGAGPDGFYAVRSTWQMPVYEDQNVVSGG